MGLPHRRLTVQPADITHSDMAGYDLASIRAHLQRGAVEPDPPSRRYACVAAILRPGSDGAEVLLIRRSEQIGDPWSGQLALPGGRHDPSDRDLLYTATRETSEEVGLDLDRGSEWIGQLADVQAVSRGRRLGLFIRPFVFAFDDPGHATDALTLNPSEVAEALWAPLGPMARGELDTTKRYVYEGHELDLPAYDVGGRVVWGLTHRVLARLFAPLDR